MYQNESWGKRSCVAFEELISLSHLESGVSDSLWKPQFHIFLTASLMIADNVQRLPGSRASDSAWRVSGETGSTDPDGACFSGPLPTKQNPSMSRHSFLLQTEVITHVKNSLNKTSVTVTRSSSIFVLKGHLF